MWSVLPMRPKGPECWLWSVTFPNYYVLYTSSWNWQMLSADQLLPGQAAWVGHYPPAELVRTPIKVNTLAFCLICLSPPSSNTGVLYVHRHLCGTALQCGHTPRRICIQGSRVIFHGLGWAISFRNPALGEAMAPALACMTPRWVSWQ